MIVFDLNNTTHEFKIIPRDYTFTELTFDFKNEETDLVSSLAVDYTLTDGYLNCSLDETFTSTSFYTLRVYDDNQNVFIGKVFVTNQTDLQNFRITKNYFTI